MMTVYRLTVGIGSAVIAALIACGSLYTARAQSTGGVSAVSPDLSVLDLDRYKNAGIVVEAARGTPTVDGILEPGEWVGANAYTGYTQFQPDPDTPATQRTTTWILYDEDNLYMAFDCRQPDNHIQDYVTRRDHMEGNPDFVGIVIDPFLTWKEGYLFLVNPAGIQTESMLGPEGEGDGSWDTLWEAEAKVDGGGWTAEISIPWNSLRFARTEEQLWGINLVRCIGETSELSVLAPLDIGSNNIMTSNALFTGVSGVRPGRSIWLNPYITARRAREGLAGGGTGWAEQSGLKYMGADLRLGLASNLIMDMTLNPDFGHIEADQERVNLTPYELFFEEKRPFFMEGQRIFQMPVNLFYSRRIYNPLAGAKLAGQVGSTQMGMVSAYNEPLGADDDNPYAFQSVVRLKRGVGTASYVGATFTSQDVSSQIRSGATYERNIGLDFDFKPSDRINVGGMAATFLEPGVGGRNNAFYLAGAYTSRSLISTFVFADAQRDFEANMGFVSRPNQQMLEPFIGYRHEADWGEIKWVTPNCRVVRFQEHSGRLIEERIGPGVSFQTRNNASFSFDYWDWRIRWNDVIHHGSNFTVQYSANQSGEWNGYAGFDVGDGFHYDDERIVFDIAGWGGITWRPTTRASLSLGTRYIQRSLEYGGELTDDFMVSSFRGQYQFTRELFGRVYLQHRRDRYDQNTGSPEKNRRLLLNALLGYEIGPGSVFYLAYNHYDLGEEPGEGVPDRVLFFKVARLFAF